MNATKTRKPRLTVVLSTLLPMAVKQTGSKPMDWPTPGMHFNPTRSPVPNATPNPQGAQVPCVICGTTTDDWVNGLCLPCSDLPGAQLLIEMRNASAWADTRLDGLIENERLLTHALADTRLDGLIENERLLTHALAEAREQRENTESLSDLCEANYVQMLELVKNIRGAGLAEPVCECGHSKGKHVVGGKRCHATIRRQPSLGDCSCSCQKFRP